MFWELRRLGIVVAAIDAVVVGLCLAICVLIGAVSRDGFASVVFVAGLAMILLGAGVGQSPLRLALPMESGRSQFAASVVQNQTNQFDPEDTSRRVQQEIDQTLGASWATAIAVASVPLLALGAALILV